MGLYAHDDVYDAALEEVRGSMTQLVLCEGQPADYAAATADLGSGGVALGEVAVDSGDGTLADGDVSGRKLTVAAQNGIDIDVSGDCDHVALVDDAGTRLLLVTTCPTKSVNSGDTADTAAYDFTLPDVS